MPLSQPGRVGRIDNRGAGFLRENEGKASFHSSSQRANQPIVKSASLRLPCHGLGQSLVSLTANLAMDRTGDRSSERSRLSPSDRASAMGSTKNFPPGCCNPSKCILLSGLDLPRRSASRAEELMLLHMHTEHEDSHVGMQKNPNCTHRARASKLKQSKLDVHS